VADQPVTTHTAGSLPGVLALARSPAAMTSTWNCQPWSSPTTVQPPGAVFQRRPAIGAKPEVWEPIEQAVLVAVQADPAARAHLYGPRLRLARH